MDTCRRGANHGAVTIRFSANLLLVVGLALGLGCEPHDAADSAPVHGRVEGVVVDPISQAPVAGARVRARDMAETRTDAAGRFELSLPVGEHRLWLDRVGFVDGQLAHVEVASALSTHVEARLFPTAPTDDEVNRYFARQPLRRHQHPAHEPPEFVAPETHDDVGSARAAIHEPPELPAVIRVWRSSRAGSLAPSASNGWADNSCDPAAEVLTLPLEEYVRGVVPHEWLPSWHPEALRAGAIAARTFAVRWAQRGGRWDCADLDDGTVTQVYRDDRSTPADEAVEATAAMVVMRDEVVISTEYSAENTNPTAFDVEDPTCTGTELFGHGRGMCQWGTHRWASGICANPPCDFGAFGAEPKGYLWMVEHYYPGATVVGGASEILPPCKLIPATGDILDDAGPCFDALGDPMYWRTETAGWDGGLLWTNAFEASMPGNWARWRMHFEAPGEYAIDVYVDGAFGAHKTARYSVTHAGGDEEVVVDQSVADGWVRLGVWMFEEQGQVRLFDNEPGPVLADQRIVADAIRIQPKGMAMEDAGADAASDAGPDGGDFDAGFDASVGGHVGASCGCRVTSHDDSGGLALLLVMLGVAWRRRHARRVSAA